MGWGGVGRYGGGWVVSLCQPVFASCVCVCVCVLARARARARVHDISVIFLHYSLFFFNQCFMKTVSVG